jgi:hypothetical protein
VRVDIEKSREISAAVPARAGALGSAPRGPGLDRNQRSILIFY